MSDTNDMREKIFHRNLHGNGYVHGSGRGFDDLRNRLINEINNLISHGDYEKAEEQLDSLDKYIGKKRGNILPLMHYIQAQRELIHDLREGRLMEVVE